MIQNITVIGAGIMGNGIAHVFAQYGFRVILMDQFAQQTDKALNTIQQNLNRQISKGILQEQDKIATIGLLHTSNNLRDAVAKADLVIEAVSEQEEVKCALFKELDTYCLPHAILASNTSSIAITKLASCTKRPLQVIGMHFMNPVPVMKLVEVVNGLLTAKETTQIVVDISKKLSKIPVIVNDAPGFISNKILMPMLNEAFYSLMEGTAGVEEIDTIMKLGMGHPMGPLQLADFIGLDVCLHILQVLYQGYRNPKYAACPLLERMVVAGKLGVKSGEGFYVYHEGGAKIKAVSLLFIS